MIYHEPATITTYWNRVGGTLIREFRAVERSNTCGHRDMDAVILLGEPTNEITGAARRQVSLKGKEVLVIQAKAKRLGMYLLGQALFSKHLIERFEPASLRTIALCQADDSVLGPLAQQYEIEVVVLS